MGRSVVKQLTPTVAAIAKLQNVYDRNPINYDPPPVAPTAAPDSIPRLLLNTDDFDYPPPPPPDDFDYPPPPPPDDDYPPPPPPDDYYPPPPPPSYSHPPPSVIPPPTPNSYSPPPPPNTFSRNSSEANSNTGRIAGATAAVFVIVILTSAIIAVLYRRRRRPPSPPGLTPPHLLSAGQSDFPDMSPTLHPRYGPVQYSYKQLCDATNNFDPSRFLGKGGFGPVYEGDIDGEFVAVKCIDESSRQGFKEFKAEVDIISDLRHRNLVKLRGWCYEETKLFLVYEYVANGSLNTILFNDERCRKELSWERRFGIVLGLGTALQYLHENCERVIIHRDIKTSNVLLDAKYTAKLGDFGLSRAISETQTYTTIVAGTVGYLAPEVVNQRIPTKESDVYSFGAVLAEIACGRRVLSGSSLLVEWLWEHLSRETLLEAVDKRLGGEYNKEEMERVLLVALACSHPDPAARPTIRVAMDILRGTAPLPAVPINKPVPSYSSSLSGSVTTTSTYSMRPFLGSGR